MYPDYTWNRSRFRVAIWDKKDKILDALDRAEAKLGIEKVLEVVNFQLLVLINQNVAGRLVFNQSD
mgnify:FL=1